MGKYDAIYQSMQSSMSGNGGTWSPSSSKPGRSAAGSRERPSAAIASAYSSYQDRVLSAGHDGRTIVSVNVHVDMSEAIRKLQLSFLYYSEELTRVALYNAINRACAPVLTDVRRAVSQQTSIPYGKVGKHILARPAHPNRLQYELLSRASSIPLIDFMSSGSVGRSNPVVRVWGRKRTLRKAFVIRGKYGVGIVKRTGKHSGGIKSKPAQRGGPLNVKTLWGPIISKEMIRPGFKSIATIKAVPQRIQDRLPHELAQAVARAKARAGT